VENPGDTDAAERHQEIIDESVNKCWRDQQTRRRQKSATDRWGVAQ